MFEGIQRVLPLIIVCGAGAVACFTYIVCLLINERKAHKNKHTYHSAKIDVYEMHDDDEEDTLIVPINKSKW